MNKHRRITKFIILTGLILSCLISNANPVQAQTVTNKSQTGLTGLLNEAGQSAGWQTEKIDPSTGLVVILGVFTRYVLSFIGVIFIIYVIFGGYLWLTAAGSEEKVDKAKKIIRDGVIGLLVITAAAAIYIFIQGALSAATIAS